MEKDTIASVAKRSIFRSGYFVFARPPRFSMVMHLGRAEADPADHAANETVLLAHLPQRVMLRRLSRRKSPLSALTCVAPRRRINR